MSVTFKYIRNGNLVTFKDSVDIDSMRIHPEYVEVTPEPTPEPVVEACPIIEEAPKRTYRSRKTEVINKED